MYIANTAMRCGHATQVDTPLRRTQSYYGIAYNYGAHIEIGTIRQIS